MDVTVQTMFYETLSIYKFTRPAAQNNNFDIFTAVKTSNLTPDSPQRCSSPQHNSTGKHTPPEE
jgi:hypothetical protein